MRFSITQILAIGLLALPAFAGAQATDKLPAAVPAAKPAITNHMILGVEWNPLSKVSGVVSLNGKAVWAVPLSAEWEKINRLPREEYRKMGIVSISNSRIELVIDQYLVSGNNTLSVTYTGDAAGLINQQCEIEVNISKGNFKQPLPEATSWSSSLILEDVRCPTGAQGKYERIFSYAG